MLTSLHYWILFVDAAQVTSTQHNAQQSTLKPTTISSFGTWMQAWNIYVTVILTHNPACALELVGYQRIVTSADHSLPLKAWLLYDGQFRTLELSLLALSGQLTTHLAT